MLLLPNKLGLTPPPAIKQAQSDRILKHPAKTTLQDPQKLVNLTNKPS